jgi:hypothetical protein
MVKGAFSSIAAAETLRSKLSQRGRTEGADGTVVRPMDVPGVLGEVERVVSDIHAAERKRSAAKDEFGGEAPRPMEAAVRGPLGEAEARSVGLVEEIVREESKRLDSLIEARPMEADPDSVPGFAEAFLVGIVRAPVMLVKTIRRVTELFDEVESEGGGEGGE